MPAQKGNILLPLISVIALVAIALAGYFYLQTQHPQNQPVVQYSNPPITPTPTPPTQDKTSNWKEYQLSIISFKIPSELKVTTNEVHIPPELYNLIDFEAKSPDYNFVTVTLGMADSGELKSGTAFGIHVQDVAKASQEFPNAKTHRSIEDDMKAVKDTNNTSPVKSSDCHIVSKVENKFWVCYITGNQVNSGSWTAVIYDSSNAYHIGLESTLNNKVTAEKTFDQILSTFKFNSGGTSANYQFDSSSVKVGSQVGSMTITSIKPLSDRLPLSNKNISIEFKGQATVTGDYYVTKPGLTQGGEPCFNNLDATSKAHLPFINGDTRDVWFCFSDSDSALRALGSNNHKTTILIDEYTINLLPAEVWNSAKFIKIIN